MSGKPIFCAVHPRACSTAFERVFLTRKDLQCIHEPFGDAWYYGPERLSTRYENDPKAREESGFSESTFRRIFERLEREGSEVRPPEKIIVDVQWRFPGKRLFIKDIMAYMIPPSQKPVSIAPSLVNYKRGVGTFAFDDQITNGTSNGDAGTLYPYPTKSEPGNPTVVPLELLKKFHWTFLIRHPSSSIPSYYRCTIPPLDKVTGFYNFDPAEAGYDEVRRFFDFVRKEGLIGPGITKSVNETESVNGENATTNGAGSGDKVDIIVIDADDLLDNPSGVVEAYCKNVGLKYDPQMLKWDTEEDQKKAVEMFEKWKGFHDDALDSQELKARTHKKVRKSDEELYKEWTQKYGEKGANTIRDTVAKCVDDYEYLKQFALKV